MPFSGIQDGNGKYLIRIPTWSPKVLYNAGTRIYYNNNYQFPDRLEIDGPTNMTLKIVVGNFIVTYVQIMIVGMGVGRMGCGLVATAVATAVYVISLSSEISLYICSLVRDLLSAAATLFTKRV